MRRRTWARWQVDIFKEPLMSVINIGEKTDLSRLEAMQDAANTELGELVLVLTYT